MQDNSHLALSVTENDISRCTKAIRQYGLLSPPVVGRLDDGTQAIISGECEFLALREMGVRTVEAIEIALNQKDEGNKLSLLLSSLKRSPNPLSEGLLLRTLMQTEQYTQGEIASFIGRSVSWVNKRLSLVTRLSPAVQELVMSRKLCPHSAQEISRLPEQAQHSFARKAVMDALPKSAIEKLVSLYNSSRCPDAAKQEILSQPTDVLKKFGINTAAPIRHRHQEEPEDSFTNVENQLTYIKKSMEAVELSLAVLDKESIHKIKILLETVRNRAMVFYGYVSLKLNQENFSPGKVPAQKEAL